MFWEAVRLQRKVYQHFFNINTMSVIVLMGGIELSYKYLRAPFFCQCDLDRNKSHVRWPKKFWHLIGPHPQLSASLLFIQWKSSKQNIIHKLFLIPPGAWEFPSNLLPYRLSNASLPCDPIALTTFDTLCWNSLLIPLKCTFLDVKTL